jgi:hypothetical protein
MEYSNKTSVRRWGSSTLTNQSLVQYASSPTDQYKLRAIQTSPQVVMDTRPEIVSESVSFTLETYQTPKACERIQRFMGAASLLDGSW